MELGADRLIVVLTRGWEYPLGNLHAFEKGPRRWTEKMSFPVTIGRNGLGWGRGLDVGVGKIEGPVKKEGDGRSPAGIFEVPSLLYGYAASAPEGFRGNYVPLTDDWVGVDDPDSQYYNRVIDRKKIADIDWTSFEIMKREDPLYRWVMFVEHNTSPVVPKAGSCIFLHLWKGPGLPTAGCTAMSESDLLRLARWTSEGRKRLLVQLPRPAWYGYEKKIDLPDLPGGNKE